MVSWLDQKYIGLLSNRLRNYKRKSSNLYNFSCPICGDSESDSRKARGYIYSKKANTLFHCHNCNVTMSIDKFISSLDKTIHFEYVKEKLAETKHKDKLKLELEEFTNKLKLPKFIAETPLKKLRKVSQLSPDHPCKIFVDSRKLPTISHRKLFWAPRFKEWTNDIIPNKFDNIEYDEGRLIIPFINEKNELHAYQGRSLSKSKTGLRYITIVVDDEVPKVYGLDSVNRKERIYVFEGPLDSLFISNGIATAGGDLSSSISFLPKEKLVIVYDNEPRSIETKKKLEKAIIAGYNVCIWPKNFEHKDVNDAILAGLTSDFIRYIIDQNTYRDLKAMMALKSWSKV
jgi:transcription elongation factor Elf1